MTAPIDLNHVGIFVRVVEAGSFTAAAADLGLPKSSISRRVTALETTLGTRLLQRTTRRLRLTDAGERYFRQTRAALTSLDEAASELADQGREPRGLVRVTAANFGDGALAEVITAFSQRYRGIHVDLTITGRRVNVIEEGFDLAVRAGFLEDSTLVARRVAQSELKLYASPDYLARRGTPRRLADVAEHECVRYRSSKGFLPWRLTGPRGSETVRVQGSVVADDFGFLHRMVVAGAGIGMLPETSADLDVARGTLVRLLPAHAMKGGAIYVVSPPLRHMPVRVALLRDHIIAELPRALRASAAPKRRGGR